LDNFYYDQAEGLRRMLAGPKPRVFTFLSAVARNEKNSTLVNLGASLARTGNSVLMLDACIASTGILSHLDLQSEKMSLLEAASRKCLINDAIAAAPQGFGIAALMRTRPRTKKQLAEQLRLLDTSFVDFADQADVVMVDAELDEDDSLPLSMLNEGEIVVLVSPDAASIKSAYALIKRLNSRFGRRPFGVLVTGASEKRAQIVFQNMAQAASRYLAVRLDSLGSVPSDEHISRAAQLGRTVIDAFPMASASVAFRNLAGYFADSGMTAARLSGMEFSNAGLVA